MQCSVRGAGDLVCHVPAKQEAWHTVAVVCWQRVLEFQSDVHCSTIPRTRTRLVELVVVVEPVLLPLPPPGAVVLNEWLLRMPNHFG